MNRIGSVASIVRYPVKSMAGESVDAGFVGFSGLFGDRAYAFVQEGGRKGFPWFTVRDLEDLLLYKPRFLHPASARAPVEIDTSLGLAVGVAPVFPDQNSFEVEVETPAGERFAIRAPELKAKLEQDSGKALVLRFSERSQCDCRPVSLMADVSVAALGVELQMPIDSRRFRANFYVTWDNSAPFYENELVGSILQIGDRTRLMVTERDPRCKIITIDPDTADESPKILRHITTNHRGTAGVYGAVLLEGMVQVGDRVNLL
jgi:uncharacterized protein YcbX